MTTFRAQETRTEVVQLQVHQEGAIRGALKGINDHKAGLPEFLKNSAGAYHRLGQSISSELTRDGRIIILLFRSPTGRSRGCIGCLDLAGMTSEDIRLFQYWFDRNASSRGDPSGELWGGHGNGAKSYMINLFRQSWFATVRDGHYTRMGWLTEDNLKIGYIPSRAVAAGSLVGDPLALLGSVLRDSFRLQITNLPEKARQILAERPCWTCFVGLQARTWFNPNRTLELLPHNAQTLRAIEYASIYAFLDGSPLLNGQRLEPEDIPTLPGGEEPYKIGVPLVLTDPDGEPVDTTNGGRYPEGTLILHTSREPMLHTLRPRHIILCLSEFRGVVGLYPVQDLAGRVADHVYGELRLESLQDYETNFRSQLHDAPLTEGVKVWLRQQVIQYAMRFRLEQEDRNTNEARNELQEFNTNVNRLLERFLEETEAEEGADGDGGGRTGGTQPRGSLPTGEVVRIVTSLGTGLRLCGENITLSVVLHFFDTTGQRVRAIPIHWESTDTAVAYAHLGSIITGQSGNCEIRAIAENGIRSQPILLQVLHFEAIELEPEDTPLTVGSRRQLRCNAMVEGNHYVDVLFDWHSNDEEIVKVGGNTGVVTAISGPGNAVVWASAYSVESNRVVVRTEGEGAGEQRPRYPRVLLSEIDHDPDTGQPKSIPPDAGTTVQDVADRMRNIFWINMRSPIAEQFRLGQSNLTCRSPEFNVYLAERYCEVIFLNALNRGDQWDAGEVQELLTDKPTRFRQLIARSFDRWLMGEWTLS